MNNQTDTKAVSVDQTINTSVLSRSGTFVGIDQISSAKEQSAQPKDTPTIDTRSYGSKEIKVEKIVIK